MRSVITIAGKDQVGIIAAVTGRLAQRNVNILDITQTILTQDFFTMVMVADVGDCSVPFAELADELSTLGEELGMVIHTQREDTFQAMHRI